MTIKELKDRWEEWYPRHADHSDEFIGQDFNEALTQLLDEALKDDAQDNKIVPSMSNPLGPPFTPQQMMARKGVMRNSVWTPYGRSIDADGRMTILARDENGYQSDFAWTEWQTMPLADSV